MKIRSAIFASSFNTALALIFCSLSLTACSTSGVKRSSVPGEEITLLNQLKAKRFKFSNGLTLVVLEDHSSPTFSYQTWFRVGSRNEVPGYTGLAHLFEHMMFKGTTNRKDGEFDRILEAAGVDGENAFTSQDYTAYVQELPSDKLRLIVELESDRMNNLVVNDAAFKTEREVVQNERRFRTENSPDGLMFQELLELAFQKHPYHWPVIGYEKDLARMSSKDAEKFYKAYYSPNQATIAVIGDVDTDQVYETIKEFYGQLPSRPSPEIHAPRDSLPKAPKRKTLRLNMPLEKVLVSYPSPELKHPDTTALMVLRAVLAGGRTYDEKTHIETAIGLQSSRLYQALVETGIASSVDVFEGDNIDPSLLTIAVSLQKKKKAQNAEQIILREFKQLSASLITQEELDRAKNTLLYQLYQSLEDNSEKARFIGFYETTAGDVNYGSKLIEQINNVTSTDVQRVARTYLNPKYRTTLVGVPK